MRMGKYRYLGKRVPDIRKHGLDTATEVREIARLIEVDYRKKRISYRTAMARYNLLELLLKKNKKLAHLSPGTKESLRREIEDYKERIKQLHEKRKARGDE